MNTINEPQPTIVTQIKEVINPVSKSFEEARMVLNISILPKDGLK